MRLPSSRARNVPGTAGHTARLEHARSFLPKTMEGTELLEIMFPAARKSASSFVGHTSLGALPLRSRAIDEWPTRCEGDCLQCGEKITGTPLPACNFKEMERYWTFGQFCRPCCALGYALEHWGEAGATRSIVWTRQMLVNVFGVPSGGAPSPPRYMLKRYGGPLSLQEFHGTDAQCTQFKAIRAPPLASFGMYMECVRGTAQAQRVAEMPTLESLRNLQRPLQRDMPLVTRQPTGRPPLLLELLATKFLGLGLGSECQEPSDAAPSDERSSKRARDNSEPAARKPSARKTKGEKSTMGLQGFFA